MDFFKDVHSVRLLGYKGRFLWADDDRRSVAQKKGEDSYGVIWRVELVPEKNAIRLKSVYDLYLMASDYPFLLGATGKKVMQSIDARSENVEWEPISAGAFVKFRTKGDKFLRANGGVPPYRNSVTHDVPVLASNQHVVLWEVEVVKKKSATPAAAAAAPSPKQSVAVPPKSSPSLPPQGPESTYDPESSVPPPLYTRRARPRRHSAPTEIDFPSGSSSPTSERLSPIASPPRQRRSSPPPPQSAGNTPRRPRRAPLASTSDDDAPLQRRRAPLRHTSVPEVPSRFVPRRDNNDDDETSSGSEESPKMSEHRLIDGAWPGISPRVKSPSDFRRIFYTVAEDSGQVLAHDDDTFGSFLFKGHTLQELTEALQLETGIDEDVILCMKNPLTNKLYKMRLQLPPNKAPLSVVLVRHNTEFGRTLSLSGARRYS